MNTNKKRKNEKQTNMHAEKDVILLYRKTWPRNIALVEEWKMVLIPLTKFALSPKRYVRGIELASCILP
jgi:hypothetical protein